MTLGREISRIEALILAHRHRRAGGASAGDPRGTRPQAGSRQTATPESLPASYVRSEVASDRE